MMKRLPLFLVAYGLWMLLTWPPDLSHAAVGIAAAGLVAYLAGDLFVGRHHLIWRPERYFRFFFHYLPVMLWEILKANLDVAYRVISPRLPIHPGIVRIRTGLVSDIGLTFLSNSITLTPGTMTVDVDRDNGYLYIHCIEVKGRSMQESTELIAGRFERILSRIFEEDAR